MGCKLCKTTGLGNFGLATGAQQFGKTIMQILVPMNATDGTANVIDCATFTPDAATILAKINDPDPSKRWYIIWGIKNLDQPKEASLKETFGDGEARFVEEGVRSAAYLLPWVTYTVLGKLKATGCKSVGVYSVDKCKNIKGEVITAGFLSPQKLAEGTFEALMNLATDTTLESATINFQYDKLVLDERSNWIDGESVTADLLNARGLIDIVGSTSNVTTTTVDVKILTDQGTCGAAIPFKSGVAADFVDNASVPSSIYNKTTASSVAVTVDAANAETGDYVLTFLAQVAANVLEIRIEKDGFEMDVVTFIAV